MPLLATGVGAVGAQVVQLAGVIPGSVSTTASAVVRSSGATIGVDGVCASTARPPIKRATRATQVDILRNVLSMATSSGIHNRGEWVFFRSSIVCEKNNCPTLRLARLTENSQNPQSSHFYFNVYNPPKRIELRNQANHPILINQ